MSEHQDGFAVRRGSLLRGTLILAAAQFLSRVLGAVYRIPLYRIIGDQGMGLVQMAYPIYSAALALSSAGLPVAISKVVAEFVAQGRRREARKSLSVSLIMLAVTGLAFSAGLIGGAKTLSVTLAKDPRSYYPILAVAPAVFIVSVMSAFRGYFQGYQNMVPTAVSQVLEQVVRVVTMFVLAYYLAPRGIEYAAAGATFGAVTGAVASLCFLLAVFFRFEPYAREGFAGVVRPRSARGRGTTVTTAGPISEYSSAAIAKRIIALAVPISAVGVVFPAMQLIDMSLVPSQLQAAGLSYETATGLYGQLSGAAGPLVNVPTIFTGALAASLVPAISESSALGLREQASWRTMTALRLTFALMVPSTVGLWVLATPITEMLYGAPEVGPILAATSGTVLFLGLQQTTSGILQGLGLASVPLWSMLAGSAVKAYLTWLLTRLWGVTGAALSTVAGFGVASVANLIIVRWVIGPLPGMAGSIAKPAVGAVAMAAVLTKAYPTMLAFLVSRRFYAWQSHALAQAAATAACVGAGAAVYFAVLLALGGLNKDDIRSIPGIGPRLARMLFGA